MKTQFIIVMGVSGCGKSTLGERLADQFDSIYIEGDELHPPENIEKMSSGTPLDDSDRWPWFDRIIAESKSHTDQGEVVFIGCSALKQSYRNYLFDQYPEGRILYLAGTFETIHNRMKERQHFMPPALLKSQFETLEEPQYHADICLQLDITNSIDELVEQAGQWLQR